MFIRLLLLIVVVAFSLTGCAATRSGPSQADAKLPASTYANGSTTQSGDDFLNAEPQKGLDSGFDADFDDWDAPIKLIADPFEPINRGVFWVNDKLYFYLFKPLARGYGAIVPRPARVSVSNFFSNVATPVRVANALLQLNLTNVGTETYRFIVNSTIGVAGLFDPATSVAEVRRAPADFGQTLGKYGFGHGFYLVLPIVGPSSLRDGTGTFVDSYVGPVRYAGLATEDLLLVRVFESTNRLSLDRDTYEGIKRDALDPYLFIRSAYAQRRLAQIGEPVYNLNILQAPVFDNEFFNPLEWFNLWQ
ncbi:VacJ family lipoprotein [Pelovirga terrestris]|uniref:VacJ family lipoprotein n=1 Tax=Pelovirga terrestris TaxID=2771352 RepID=A0A8J6URP1_9BACT|nr:VacJ family lipoprotein [Pelovirga terrestris]MBD1401671.1 VacJ family lipoprotein [Pelovirga terrestris]